MGPNGVLDEGAARPVSLEQLAEWAAVLQDTRSPLLGWTEFQRLLLRAQITLGFFGCLCYK